MIMTGTIRTLYLDKAFGFITTPDKGDYFFHRTSVQPPTEFAELQVGQQVEFEPQPKSPKGPRAEYVRALDAEEDAV